MGTINKNNIIPIFLKLFFFINIFDIEKEKNKRDTIIVAGESISRITKLTIYNKKGKVKKLIELYIYLYRLFDEYEDIKISNNIPLHTIKSCIIDMFIGCHINDIMLNIQKRSKGISILNVCFFIFDEINMKGIKTAVNVINPEIEKLLILIPARYDPENEIININSI